MRFPVPNDSKAFGSSFLKKLRFSDFRLSCGNIIKKNWSQLGEKSFSIDGD